MGRTGKRVKVRGAKRMTQLGYHPSQVWVDDTRFETLKRAADQSDLILTAYILRAATSLARGEFTRHR
jgi:hypothetical protein